jgi:hypothetical protein
MSGWDRETAEAGLEQGSHAESAVGSCGVDLWPLRPGRGCGLGAAGSCRLSERK